MQIKTFWVNARGDETAEEALNRFLRGHRVLEVEKQLVVHGLESYWCFCVAFLENAKPTGRTATKKPDKIDYKEKLSAEAFIRYARYRDIRKKLSEEEAVPGYVIFTNKELAAMAGIDPLTTAALRNIDGIGAKKVAKYAEHFVYQAADET